MSSSDGFFRRVAIWGVGLIGGSIGMAIRRHALAAEVVGIGQGALDEAVARGAVDRYLLDPAEALDGADLLILAMPVGAMIDLARVWGPQIRPGTLVTDVGSTKAQVVAAWEQHLPPGAAFVGGHPMFGSERSGVAAAAAGLVKGCRWVLTAPHPALQGLIERLGAVPVVMTPAEHDRRVAGISHLPQVVATALAASALDLEERGGGVLDLAAGGFRDTTRIAESPADLWAEVLLTNPDAVREALITFRQALGDLEAAIDAGDRAAIEALFARAQQARKRLPSST